MKLLLATTNPGKVLEYREILKDLAIEIISLRDLKLENFQVEEDGKTFEENAIKKSKYFCKLTNLPTLADDGGLEIDALGGEPGVKSRRWPGYEASDEELIKMTLEKLQGLPREKRGARLRCSIAISFPGEEKVHPVRDRKDKGKAQSKQISNGVHLFEGILRGFIMEKPIGIIPGFPFRSLFYLPKIGKVLGELSMEEEAKIAHRKRAMEKAMPLLKEKLSRQGGIPQNAGKIQK